MAQLDPNQTIINDSRNSTCMFTNPLPKVSVRVNSNGPIRFQQPTAEGSAPRLIYILEGSFAAIAESEAIFFRLPEFSVPALETEYRRDGGHRRSPEANGGD